MFSKLIAFRNLQRRFNCCNLTRPLTNNVELNLNDEPTVVESDKTIDDDKLVVKKSEKFWRTEESVGITEFIGDRQNPFIGLLKRKFKDFVVHEINRYGQEVRLENADQPEDIFANSDEKFGAETRIEPSDLKLDPQVLENLRFYAENPSTTNEPFVIPVSDLHRDDRNRIHAFIRQHYPHLDSHLVKFGHQQTELNVVPSDGIRWPPGAPSCVRFVLYKQHLETSEAAADLAFRLGRNVSVDRFGYAGNKDKQACTTQQFSAWKISPTQIWEAVQRFNRDWYNRFHRVRLMVGHFELSHEPYRLGQNSGNHFEIVLRNVRRFRTDQSDRDRQATEAITEEEMRTTADRSLAMVRDVGFINYFGMQRFGGYRIGPHDLGRLLVRRQFRQLVTELMRQRTSHLSDCGYMDTGFVRAVQTYLNTGDAATAFKMMGHKTSQEAQVLAALANNSNRDAAEPLTDDDCRSALVTGLGHRSLFMLNAYQSYLWNRVASFRYRHYGLEVVEGDLVSVPVTHEPIDPRTGDIPRENIVLVTAENRWRYSIYDVVLPHLAGIHHVPHNAVGDYIDQIFAEESIRLEDFLTLPKPWGSLTHKYRNLVVRPGAFEWQWIESLGEKQVAIDTDRIKVLKVEPTQEVETLDLDEQTINGDPDSTPTKRLPKLALLLRFSLPRSAYATMLLREVTKLNSTRLQHRGRQWKKS